MERKDFVGNLEALENICSVKHETILTSKSS